MRRKRVWTVEKFGQGRGWCGKKGARLGKGKKRCWIRSGERFGNGRQKASRERRD
jgi:hypothetical protein